MKITKFFALLCAVVGLVGCETTKNEPNVDPQGKIKLSADKTTVEIGESVTFTVVDSEGNDLTKSASIYDNELNKITNPWTPEKSGAYTFNATVGAESSNNVTISVMAQMPEVPVDSDPTNLAFNHLCGR